MILKATIAAKDTSRMLELRSRLPDAHLFQYFESEINSAILRETIRETVARAPLCVIVSTGNNV